MSCGLSRQFVNVVKCHVACNVAVHIFVVGVVSITWTITLVCKD